MTAQRVPIRVKVAYGASEFSGSVAFTAIAIYFLIFLTDVAGISPGIASAIFAVAVIWDAFSDPAMGIISDRTRSRYGRRRPYLLAVAIPFGVILWMTFTVPPFQGFMQVAYFVAMAVAIHTALTVMGVPYTALVAEMTQDYNERASLVTYRSAWSQLGSIVAATLPLLIVGQFADEELGWSVVGAFLGACCILPILYTWHGTRGWERVSLDSEPLKASEVFAALIGNRSFRYLAAVYLLAMFAIYAVGALNLYFLQYWMGLTQDQISTYFFILFGCSILWIPVIALACNRVGKRTAYIVFIGAWAIVSSVGIMLVQPGQLGVLYSLAIVGSIGTTATYQLIWAMIPDVVEVDEFKSGKRREGLYYGAAMFIVKLGSALAVFLVGQTLAWLGYVANEVQPPAVLFGIRLMLGPGIALILGSSVVVACFMPMTRRRHQALIRAIEARKAGRPWDEEEIRCLL